MKNENVTPGRLIRSITKGSIARIVSVSRLGDGSNKVTLDFGWDAPRSRFWTTTVSHTVKYYTEI